MPALGTNGTAGSLSATTTPQTASLTCKPGTTIRVRSIGSTSQVNLEGVHAADDFDHIDAATAEYYVTGAENPVLTYKTPSGTATLYVAIGVPGGVAR